MYTGGMKGRYWIVFVITTLVLHGLWEHTHIVLYTNYAALEGILPVWMFATLGDLLYTFVIIGVISVLKRSITWVYNSTRSEYALAIFFGFLIALVIEYKGLYLGRWEYGLSMPIIPLLHVGLSPILQMMLITPLSLFITKKVIQHVSYV